MLAQGSGLVLTVLGQRYVRATRVPSGERPLSLAMANQVKTEGFGETGVHTPAPSIAAVYSP